MFQGRRIRRVVGSGLAISAAIMMLGTGGAVEAGTITVGMAFFRMILGCIAILAGAALFGGLE